MNTQPTTLDLQRANIPAELTMRDQWVGWFWKRLGEKYTKVPHCLTDERLASSDDRDTWAPFTETERKEQIGFVFSSDDPYCGIDIDECLDPATGEIDEDAKKIIDELSSYSEISPSGNGVKIFVKGRVPGPRRKNTQKQIEMYDSGRFFTVTGHRLESAPTSIEERQEAIDKLYNWLFPPPTTIGQVVEHLPNHDLSDEDILSKAFRARNGDKFFRLWNGDITDYPSQSEADLALCDMLAFWTGPDPGRVEEMFGKSELAERNKWHEREYYRHKTVAKALEKRTEFYGVPFGNGSYGNPGNTAHTGNTLQICSTFTEESVTESYSDGVTAVTLQRPVKGFDTFTLSELMEKEFAPVQWVVPGLIPEGTMLLAGKPKIGKSWMALGLCIAVSTGTPFLGEMDVDQGDVLYLALEDNERRLQERSEKVLGDVPHNHRLHMATVAMRLDEGALEALELWLSSHEEAKLVVIDTMTRVRSQRERKTLYEQDYEVVAELTTLAGKHRVAIILIHHLKKGDTDDPMDLISGSTGLTAGVDGCMVLTRVRSEADAIVKVMHREVKEDPELALRFDQESTKWILMGDAEEYRIGKERRDILGVLAREDGPMSPADIAEALGKSSGAIRKLLHDMMEDGQVDSPGYGQYVLAKSVTVPPQLLPPKTSSGNTSVDKTPANGQGVTGVTTVTGGAIQEDMEWT